MSWLQNYPSFDIPPLTGHWLSVFKSPHPHSQIRPRRRFHPPQDNGTTSTPEPSDKTFMWCSSEKFLPRDSATHQPSQPTNQRQRDPDGRDRNAKCGRRTGIPPSTSTGQRWLLEFRVVTNLSTWLGNVQFGFFRCFMGRQAGNNCQSAGSQISAAVLCFREQGQFQHFQRCWRLTCALCSRRQYPVEFCRFGINWQS